MNYLTINTIDDCPEFWAWLAARLDTMPHIISTINSLVWC